MSLLYVSSKLLNRHMHSHLSSCKEIHIIIILIIIKKILKIIMMMMMMMTITIIITMIIIIALKGTNRDCLQSPHCVANCLQHAGNRVQITCSTESACHVQHGVCHAVGKDSSAIKFERVKLTFFLPSFYWLNHKPTKKGRKPEYPEKTPDDELQKMPHTKTRQIQPELRLEPAL